MYFDRSARGIFRTIHYDRSLAISIGIGPFIEGSKIQDKTIKWLKDCDWISVRDEVAFEFCQINNIQNVFLHSDLIYNRYLWSNDGKNFYSHSSCLKNITIIIRDWEYATESRRYIESLLVASKQLLSSGYSIKFLSFSKGGDSKSIIVIKKHGFTISCWDPELFSIDEFVRESYGKVDLIISARAHGLIVASALKIPAFAIEIEPKLKIINKQINGSHPIWSPPFSSSEFISIIRKLSTNWMTTKRSMVSNSEILAQKAKNSVSEFSKNI